MATFIATVQRVQRASRETGTVTYLLFPAVTENILSLLMFHIWFLDLANIKHNCIFYAQNPETFVSEVTEGKIASPQNSENSFY